MGVFHGVFKEVQRLKNWIRPMDCLIPGLPLDRLGVVIGNGGP
jgi:hypothetical protein